MGRLLLSFGVMLVALLPTYSRSLFCTIAR